MTALFFIAASVIIYIILRAIDNRDTHMDSSPSQSMPSHTSLTVQEREALRQANKVGDHKTYNAIVEGTYTGPLPQQIEGYRYTNMYPDIYRTQIAGINYQRGLNKFAGMHIACRIEAEPRNKYDKNAIKILNDGGQRLGYIPASETSFVRKFLNGQLPYTKCKAHIDDEEESYYDENLDIDRTRHYMTGEIIIYKPNIKMFK